ncbi:MAG: sigma-70 family RNA polymerase sigma factor [Bacteroidales bacterium]|jgi:RNA polymerase sigma-70 factor (ECF subfamily)|nr:sigma-70 family RNA polymerase sigma factor [Bacteroidales bacterium]
MRDPSTYTEAELIAGCVRGERKAQQVLYERYASVMYPVCIRYLGREDAKDVLQDGFLTVFDKIGTYKGEGSFEGWMRKIFVNACLMQIRKSDALRFSEDIAESPELGGVLEHGVLEQIESRQILDLIAQLPPGLRSVFNLFVMEGYSHAEVAEALGMTEQSSRSQVSRARSLLQKKIKELYNGKK